MNNDSGQASSQVSTISPRDFNVQFIGHSGFAVQSAATQILVDAWFTPSSFQKPVLRSMLPGHQTIDYLIPEPQHTIDQFKPSVLLISHFHSHHAPADDIRALAMQSDGLILACPQLAPARKQMLEENLGDLKAKIEILPLNPMQSFKSGKTEIVCLPHTSPERSGWLVISGTSSFMHLTDSPVNANWWDRRIDPTFAPLAGLRPSIFAVGSGGHTERKKREGKPIIRENSTMGPYEAARFAHFIGAKAAGVMGMYNFSIWKDRLESMLPSDVVENEFRWAHKHLDPSSQTLLFRPGCELTVESHPVHGQRIFTAFA